jgi:hypothetical protein
MMTEGFKPLYRATYKDVGMALNLNRLIVSAPPCTLQVSLQKHAMTNVIN